jgi:hypothetical protein
MDYAPEFTSMVYPNDEAGQLAKLKAEYGAEPAVSKMLSFLHQKVRWKPERKNILILKCIHRIRFIRIGVRDWMFLLGAMEMTQPTSRS